MHQVTSQQGSDFAVQNDAGGSLERSLRATAEHVSGVREQQKKSADLERIPRPHVFQKPVFVGRERFVLLPLYMTQVYAS